MHAYAIESIRASILFLACAFQYCSSFMPTASCADKIMGQIQFIPATKAIKTSGVWIDGQYVGYLGELEGT